MRRIKVVLSASGIYEPVITEEIVVGKIKKYLKDKGAKVFRAIERVPKCYRCGNWLGASEPGTPDLSGYFYRDGITPFYFEVKRPKGKGTQKGAIRPAQLARINEMRADGVCAAIVDSVEQVQKELKEFGVGEFSVGIGGSV